MAAIVLRPEPYDPDAKDADGDGIVQERTPWERPAGTRLLDFSGSPIERGRSLTERPAGLRIVDKNGNAVAYTPSYARAGAGKSSLSQIGVSSLAERGMSSVRSIRGPRVVRAPESLVSRSFDDDIRRATTLLKPINNADLSRLSPKERRRVEKYQKVAAKLLSAVDEPEERSVLSSFLGNSFYWAATLGDKSGTFTTLLNSIWSGSQDAGYNPHEVMERMYEWGGAFAIAYPLLQLKERMNLSRRQVGQVAARLKERFDARRIKAGELNDRLKERISSLTKSVDSAFKTREAQKVITPDVAEDLFAEAQQVLDGPPEGPDKSRWRRIPAYELEGFARRRDPQTLFMRDTTPEEYEAEILNGAMNAWRGDFGQSYRIEEAARAEFDPDYWESRWARGLVEAIDKAPIVGTESIVRPGQRHAYRVDSRNFAVGEVVDFPLISSAASTELVSGYEGFNDVLGASEARGTYIDFVNAPGVVHSEREVREFIMSGRFRVTAVEDYTPAWENRPGAPVGLRGQRKMVRMEYLGPSEQVKVRSDAGSPLAPEPLADTNAEAVVQVLGGSPKQAAPHVLGTEDVEAGDSWEDDEVEALLDDAARLSAEIQIAARKSPTAAELAVLGISADEQNEIFEETKDIVKEKKGVAARVRGLFDRNRKPTTEERRWEVSEKGEELLGRTKEIGTRVREEAVKRLKRDSPELLEELADLEQERLDLQADAPTLMKDLEEMGETVRNIAVREYIGSRLSVPVTELEKIPYDSMTLEERQNWVDTSPYIPADIRAQAQRLRELKQRHKQYEERALEARQKVAKSFIRVLQEIRPMGKGVRQVGIAEETLEKLPTWDRRTEEKRDELVQDISDVLGDLFDGASEMFPDDWWNEFNARGEVSIEITDRAFWGAGKNVIGVDKNALVWATYRDRQEAIEAMNELQTTMIHELGHGFASRVPEVGFMERMFLWSRSAKDKEMVEYLPDELCYEDQFHSPYVGKVYGGGELGYGTEIMSMGMQLIFGKSQGSTPGSPVMPDTEYLDFVLGVLSTAGLGRSQARSSLSKMSDEEIRALINAQGG